MVFAGIPAGERRERAMGRLRGVGLEPRAAHRPDQLSGGERQRVAIARATVLDPKLLLADEPTGNLDTASGRHVLEILEQMNASGLTLIVVTHDPAVARRARRVLVLKDGRVVHRGDGRRTSTRRSRSCPPRRTAREPAGPPRLRRPRPARPPPADGDEPPRRRDRCRRRRDPDRPRRGRAPLRGRPVREHRHEPRDRRARGAPRRPAACRAWAASRTTSPWTTPAPSCAASPRSRRPPRW